MREDYEEIATQKEKNFYWRHKLFRRWGLGTAITMGIFSLINLIYTITECHWLVGWIGMGGMTGIFPSMIILLVIFFYHDYRKISIDSRLRRRHWDRQEEAMNRRFEELAQRGKREQWVAQESARNHFDEDLFTL